MIVLGLPQSRDESGDAFFIFSPRVGVARCRDSSCPVSSPPSCVVLALKQKTARTEYYIARFRNDIRHQLSLTKRG